VQEEGENLSFRGGETFISCGDKRGTAEGRKGLLESRTTGSKIARQVDKIKGTQERKGDASFFKGKKGRM